MSEQPISGKFLLDHHLFFLFLFLEAVLVIRYRKLHPQFIKNLKITSEMEKRHSTELPFGLESEIQKEESIGKRPLLWRLDAFLSRKSGNS